MLICGERILGGEIDTVLSLGSRIKTVSCILAGGRVVEAYRNVFIT